MSSNMPGTPDPSILSGHGTAERGIGAGSEADIGTSEGANIGGVGPGVSAGSGENSFEVVPPQ